MQLIQKVAGRPGAKLHAPAPLHQIAPWYAQQQAAATPPHSYSQAAGGPVQQHPQGSYSAQPSEYPQQASQPAQQGCGGFLQSLFAALFGK